MKTFATSENLSMYQSHGVHQSTLLNSTKYKPGAGLGLNGGSWQRDPPRAPVTRSAANKRAAESPRSRVAGTPEDHEVGGHRLRGSISPTLGAQVPRRDAAAREQSVGREACGQVGAAAAWDVGARRWTFRSRHC